jgi:putative transcriptional regulator
MDFNPHKATRLTPSPGRLLIAEPFLSDPNFSRSVILLCESGTDGTVGFMLNKPTELNLGDLLPELYSETLPIFHGGPVHMDTLHILHRVPQILGGIEIAPGTYWGGSYEALQRVVYGKDINPADIRLFVGYSGWSPGQLDQEMNEGSWLVSETSPSLLFDTESTDWRICPLIHSLIESGNNLLLRTFAVHKYMFMHLGQAFFLLIIIVLSGCSKNKAGVPPRQDTGGGYFSILQFAGDQFKTFRGTPFVIEKEIVLNGKQDSLIVNSYSVDWEPILIPFLQTDISSPDLQDQYEASLFNDGAGANVLYYTAKTEKLPVKMVQVRVDTETDRILSVYAETGKKSFWNEESQKLYYVPMKLIQIQEFSNPLLGAKKELRVEYRFML